MNSISLDININGQPFEIAINTLTICSKALLELKSIYDDHFEKRWADTCDKLFPNERREHYFIVSYDIRNSQKNLETHGKANYFIKELY